MDTSEERYSIAAQDLARHVASSHEVGTLDTPDARAEIDRLVASYIEARGEYLGVAGRTLMEQNRAYLSGRAS